MSSFFKIYFIKSKICKYMTKYDKKCKKGEKRYVAKKRQKYYNEQDLEI